MKTAFEKSGLAPALLLSIGVLSAAILASPGIALAQQNVAPLAAPTSPSAPTNASATPVAATTPPALSTPETAAGASAAPVPGPTSDANTTLASPAGPGVTVGANDQDKHLSNMEDKMTDSVKGVVKRLSAGSNDFNLEDLNTARIAVAKIEAMIDIEKHLVELEKLKGERQDKAASNVQPVAASALAPSPIAAPAPIANIIPPSFGNMAPQNTSMPGSNMIMGSGKLEVAHISGANGLYTAEFHMPDGTSTSAAIGDKLPDGSLVVGITSTQVSLKHNGTTRQMKINGVGTVYGQAL